VQPLELLGVRVEQPANTPVLLLRELAGEQRVLPIYIGGPEAASIALALDGDVPPRPLTHDLLRNVLVELGAEVVQVVITELQEHTFFAELHLRLGGVAHVISCRPSDAVALAVRAGSPLFAADAVLDVAGKPAEPDVDDDDEDDDGSPDEILEEFRAFIEDVRPEDFEA
jgi:bifunctional DNase/RNase